MMNCSRCGVPFLAHSASMDMCNVCRATGDEVPNLFPALPIRLKALNDDTVYVVADMDDHADPDYSVFFDKEEALAKARECVKASQERYEGMRTYVTPCDGRYGFWFSEYGEDRWKVQVQEAKIK